jgi:uncharacterized phiE125 gp8 family phage protein
MFEIYSQSAHPFTVAMARDHMRISDSANDDALTRALDAAVAQVENQTAVFMRATQIRHHFRGDPDGVRLFGGPHKFATSLAIYKGSDALATTAFERDRTGGTVRIRTLERGAFDRNTDYFCTYNCGYEALSDIPGDLVTAVLELAGLHFENREAATPVQLYALPFSIRAILATYHTGGI